MLNQTLNSPITLNQDEDTERISATSNRPSNTQRVVELSDIGFLVSSFSMFFVCDDSLSIWCQPCTEETNSL
jgi:hypothetical protein